MAGRRTTTAILHVAVVQILSLVHKLDYLGPKLLILSFLNLEFTFELDDLSVTVLDSLLKLGRVLQNTLLLSLKYIFDLPSFFILLIEG